MTSFVPKHTAPPTVLTAVHYGWLALGMIVLGVYGNLIPLNYEPMPLREALAAFRRIGLINPSDLGARGDWVVSVVLFLTVSYLLMAALCVDRPRLARWWAAPIVVVFCAILIVAIEFTQVFFPPRTVSINDIIVETVGAVAGTVVWLIAGKRITQWVRRLTAPTDLWRLAARLLPGYFVLLLVVALMPFDFTVSREELAVKFEENKVWLVPFSHYGTEPVLSVLVKLILNMACFFPLGFLVAMADQARGVRRKRWPYLLVIGLAVTTLVEFLQLLVYSRVCDTTDIITGTLAVMLGWQVGWLCFTAWRAALARSSDNFFGMEPASWGRHAALASLFLAWFAIVLYVNWTPFDFTTDPTKFPDGPEELPVYGLRRMSVLPVVDYYWGSKYQALDQFLKKSAMFIPLGILCAFASPRIYRRGAVPTVLLIALIAGIAIEAGRYFLPSHSASVTDVLLQCGGAWLGFRLTQHVRALLWAESALYGYLYRQS